MLSLSKEERQGVTVLIGDFVLVGPGHTMFELALFFIFLRLAGGSQFSGRCVFL